MDRGNRVLDAESFFDALTVIDHEPVTDADEEVVDAFTGASWNMLKRNSLAK